tara:strand:- start:1545 stop:1847 length:303 start_codon:yes stop_codon:yes gene_type:complete
MATTTWGLANTEYDLSDGFVHTAHWTCVRTDGNYSASSYGSCSLTRPETLTTRTELTTAEIITDVKQILGSNQVILIENSLVSKISESKTPTQGSFVPST